MKHIFNTGAQRDDDDGKARIDLVDIDFMTSAMKHYRVNDLPPYVPSILEYGVHTLPKRISPEKIAMLAGICIRYEYANNEYTTYPPPLMLRFGALMASGAKHYGADNWRKGMPFSRVYQSLLRHVYQWLNTDTGEDHFVAVLFNLMCLYVYLGDETLPTSLNDLETVGDGDA